MLLSIVVPSFNAGDFVSQSIESLCSVQGDWFEILLIDDGSTDGSVEVIEREFVSEIQNGRLKIFSIKNSGVSVARNVGIENATGEYITFVDADDMVINGYHHEIYSILLNEDVDIVELGFRRFENFLSDGIDSSILPHSGFYQMFNVIDDIFAKSIWYSPIRILKRTLVADNRYPVGVRFCEDLIFLEKIFSRANTIFFLNKPLYAYRITQEGATRTVRDDYAEKLINYYKSILENDEYHYKLLKANLAYIIYRCETQMGKKVSYCREVKLDMWRVFSDVYYDNNLELRKKLCLVIPNSYWLFCKIKMRVLN